MQRLSPLLAPTAPTCQPSNQIYTLTSLRLTPSSSLLVQFCASQAAYVAAAVNLQQLPGMLCIKKKQEKVFCRGLVTEEMADCIVQLHCITGSDATSGFQTWQDGSSRCRDSLDLEEEVGRGAL
ncbi:hypothetical protein NHX12_010637 [Muraenolepis orangiensis]|uniref:Uncharacterized protein n=1 Tax=Muraenolepis orangiensis TaxID=630683 RepID=A0A9Q0IAN3_9TELE|nr:hypothetical protein NHX12_010637 [Muraenolepis orangiensis]